METLTKYAAVAAGSALGGVARYFLAGAVLSRVAAPFPLATLLVNLSGSFALGLFLTLATERLSLGPTLRLAIAVGFIGSYTTFSTFEYETMRLGEERGFALALLNVILSVALGFAAVWGGQALAHRWAGVPATSHALYEQFERQADAADPAQSEGAPRDIRDATIAAMLAEREPHAERERS